jgi:hypothetical protein
MKNMFFIENDVVSIKLTKGKWADFDIKDIDLLASYTWCTAERRTRTSVRYYAVTYVRGQLLFMHQILMPDREIDHIDGNGLNNRRSNLRPATRSQNQQNRQKTTGLSSRYKGVSYDTVRGKWQAYINKDGRRIALKRFDTEEEAALWYNEMAKKLFGDYASINVLKDMKPEGEA